MRGIRPQVECSRDDKPRRSCRPGWTFEQLAFGERSDVSRPIIERPPTWNTQTSEDSRPAARQCVTIEARCPDVTSNRYFLFGTRAPIVSGFRSNKEESIHGTIENRHNGVSAVLSQKRVPRQPLVFGFVIPACAGLSGSSSPPAQGFLVRHPRAGGDPDWETGFPPARE